MEARDLDGVLGAMAPDVVVRSPIFDVPFVGREEVGNLFGVLLEIFDELEYLADVPGDGVHVLHFRVRIEGEDVQGVDILRFDDQGLISEMTVMLRPLAGIAHFMDVAGPKLAGRQGRVRGLLARLLGGPPAIFMRLAARLGPGLIGLKRR
jgi:SnoaL-like protein